MSAVEFALVLPVLMLLLTGVVQYGAIFMLQNNMQNVAREASLRLSTGDLTTNGARNWALERLPRPTNRYSVDVRRDGDVFTVSIRAPLRSAVPVDPLKMFAKGDLTVQAAAREVSL